MYCAARQQQLHLVQTPSSVFIPQHQWGLCTFCSSSSSTRLSGAFFPSSAVYQPSSGEQETGRRCSISTNIIRERTNQGGSPRLTARAECFTCFWRRAPQKMVHTICLAQTLCLTPETIWSLACKCIYSGGRWQTASFILVLSAATRLQLSVELLVVNCSVNTVEL